MQRIKSFLGLLLLVFSLATVGNAFAEDGMDKLGIMKKGAYENSYFGFDVSFPKEWHSLSKKQILFLSQLGKKMVAGGNKELEKKLAENKIKRFYLFVVTKKPLGSQHNAVIQAEAINASMLGGKVSTGKEYIGILKLGLGKLSHLKPTFGKDSADIQIGGKTFSQLDVTMTIRQTKVYQHFFVANMKGYMLIFLTSYSDKADKNKLQDVLKTVKFKA